MPTSKCVYCDYRHEEPQCPRCKVIRDNNPELMEWVLAVIEKAKTDSFCNTYKKDLLNAISYTMRY